MMPFDNLVTTRLQQKDQFRPCIPRPMLASAVLPAPTAHNDGVSNYESLSSSAISEIGASFARTAAQFPRGEDALPAAPTSLYGIQPAPVGPPDLALAPHGIANKL